jgi:hypothetical protein
MVSYTTVEYYTDKYLMGRQAVIDTAVFPFYAQKATQVIKQYTFDNVDETKPFKDEIQMCCCEVAEHLYTTEEHNKSKPVGVTSEKVGEYSVSYESNKATEDISNKKIRNIIYSWLSDTGYLYKGV